MDRSLNIILEKISRRLNRAKNLLRSVFYLRNKSDELEPRVCYALQVPEPGEVATGGRVKLLALSRKFPDTQIPNLLYLVSSALPENYRFWVERASRLGIPIVLNQNGVATPGWAGSNTDAINSSLKWVIERANFVLYQSEFCRKSADLFLKYTPTEFRIAYNAVDLRTFTPNKNRVTRPLTILLGGSQYQKYRVTSALEAFAHICGKIPDARLIISGKVDWQNNPSKSLRETKELARELGVASGIHFTGTFLQSAAPELYRSADLLLHTKYNDPCPTAVIEALASGLPVVYSRSGGLPELVDASSGIGVAVPQSYDEDHSPTPHTWAGAILEVVPRLSEMSIRARVRAEEFFGLDRWLSLHEQVFQRLIR